MIVFENGIGHLAFAADTAAFRPATGSKRSPEVLVSRHGLVPGGYVPERIVPVHSERRGGCIRWVRSVRSVGSGLTIHKPALGPIPLKSGSHAISISRAPHFPLQQTNKTAPSSGPAKIRRTSLIILHLIPLYRGIKWHLWTNIRISGILYPLKGVYDYRYGLVDGESTAACLG